MKKFLPLNRLSNLSRSAQLNQGYFGGEGGFELGQGDVPSQPPLNYAKKIA